MKFISAPVKGIMTEVQITKARIIRDGEIDRHFKDLNKTLKVWADKHCPSFKQEFLDTLKKPLSQTRYKMKHRKLESTLLKDKLEEINNKKIFTMNTKSNREIKLDYYVRMVSQNYLNKQRQEDTLLRAKAQGEDLVKVSSHIGSCSLCLQYQGNIYSISGNSNKYPILPQNVVNVHVNCHHYLIIYRET
jgi:hypothetical protein